ARGEAELAERAGSRARLDGRPAGATQRLAEQRVGREMEEVHVERPGGQIPRRKSIRGAAVRDEAPSPARRNMHPDPAGPLPGDAGRAEANALVADRRGERPSLRVAAHRADARPPHT